MEKESQPDSMATITMKPDYPPSEVYSASEPPPAYRQRTSSSVQIARIVALTVVASSFILGSFILASSWVQARASCHQLEQLDAMLDKELALESRAYGNDGLLPEELPIANAHALHASTPSEEPLATQSNEGSQPSPTPANQVKDDGLNHAESKIDEDKLQKLDGDESRKPSRPDTDDSSESDSSVEDEDELDAMRPLFKLPLQFDLDDIAGAFLANNQKGRMNCVVEKRNEEPMERRFPFNLLAPFAPRAAPASAERIAIICHGGDEPRGMESFPEPQSQVFAFPLSGPVRLPVRPQPQRGPGPMPFPEFARGQGSPFNIHMPWDSSEEQQGPNPRVPPREMRIHVQRVIAVPAPHNMSPADMGPFAPPPPPSQHHEQNEQSSVVHQFVPQPAPTQDMELPEVQRVQIDGAQMQSGLPWGLTPELIQMIHHDAEESAASQRREQQIDNDMQEVKTIVNTLVTAATESEEEPATQAQPVNAARAPRTVMIPHERDPAVVDGMPHYVQPRSVRTARSVDAMLDTQKRVKRCSCACK